MIRSALTTLSLLLSPLTAQQSLYPPLPQFTASYTFAAGGKLTIQQPASGARPAELVSGFYQCDAAATVTQSRNGTAATATTLTPVNMSGGGAPGQTVWKDSDVGAGTVVLAFACAAGEKGKLDLVGVSLLGSGTAINYSLAVSAGTGVVGVNWRQR